MGRTEIEPNVNKSLKKGSEKEVYEPLQKLYQIVTEVWRKAGKGG